MRKNVEKSIEIIAKEQALREKFEKEYAPILQAAKEEKNVQKEVVKPKVVEENVETANEEIDFTEFENSEDFKKRLYNKNIKNKVYIRDSKKIISKLSKVPFTTNSVVDSLMYRNVKTEQFTYYFKKKIGDNPKNIELLLDLLKNRKANFNMVTSFASSGKTYTFNTVFNRFRDYNEQMEEAFITGLCINGISDSLVMSNIEENINKMIFDYQAHNRIRKNEIKKLKSAKAPEDKIKEKEKAYEQELEEQRKKFLKDFYFGELTKCKKGGKSEVQEINDYVENNPTSLIQILVTPNRIQNEQNQEEEKYNFTAIIGQNGNEIKFDADTNYSVVIEKLTEVLSKIEISPVQAKINLVIDEAHVLVEQKNFRNDAINSLLKVVSKVLELNGSVIFMTATPENLKCFNFDKIISFIPVEDVKNADKVKVYVNKDENLSMHDYALSVMKHLKNPLVRYNTKDGIQRAKETLESFGYKVETVTADDKKAELFRTIVKKSALTKADKWICSSVIEVGTNIIGVVQEDGSISLVDITPTYIMNNINNCSFDSMEQFFARIRYKVPAYALVIPQKSSEIENISNIDVLLSKEITRVEIFYNKLKEIAMVYINVSSSKEEAIQNVKGAFESCKCADGTPYHCNCIYFDNDTLEVKVDIIALWKNVYKKFIQQYYYHPELLVKRLNRTLGINVEIVEEEFDKIKTKTVNNSDMMKSIAKDKMRSLSGADIKELEKVITKEISISDICNKERQEKIDTILRVQSYAKYLKDAYYLDIKLSDIIDVILIAETEKDIKEYLQSAFYVKGNMLYKKEKVTLSIEQDIILKELYKTKPNGDIKEIYISETDIIELSKKIGEKTNKKVKKMKNDPKCKEKDFEYGIGYKETFKLIKYIFTIHKPKKNEEKYRIKALRTNCINPKDNKEEGEVA